jgi:hypothetical protein
MFYPPEITLRFARSGGPVLDDDVDHFEPQTFLVLEGALQLRLAFCAMYGCNLIAPRARVITGASCSLGDHYVRNVFVEHRGNRLSIRYNPADEMGSAGPMRVTRTIALPRGATLCAVAGDIAPREELPSQDE